MYSDLYQKETYLTDDKYVSGKITEYDIKQANINMLIRANVIDQSYYNFLSNIPKQDREIEIGNLHLSLLPKGINISQIISDSIRDYRHKLFEANSILDSEVVRIAKDAVYILRSYDLSVIDFDGVVFRPKMVSSAMLNLNKILIFSSYNNLDQIDIQVKGLGKNDIYHQNGMLSLIANVMYMIDRVSIQDALLYIQDTYKKYVNRELPIDYYREFNSYSCYKIMNSNLAPMHLTDMYIHMLDITYNLNIIRDLYSIVFNLYTTRNRL